MSPTEALKSVNTVLVVDWPTKDVPEALALAGFHVVVRGGPGPSDYSVYRAENGSVVTRHFGRPPERADLVYVYRPASELPELIDIACRLGAKLIWTQSGLDADGKADARGCWIANDDLRKVQELAEKAGLNHISEPYIGDVARAIGPSR